LDKAGHRSAQLETRRRKAGVQKNQIFGASQVKSRSGSKMFFRQ
jgi:hypothetical protein